MQAFLNKDSYHPEMSGYSIRLFCWVTKSSFPLFKWSLNAKSAFPRRKSALP